MNTRGTRFAAIAALLAALMTAYCGALGYATHKALYPKWYRPGAMTPAGPVHAPCSNYQKRAYLYCGDPRSDFNLDFEVVSGERALKDRMVAFSGWFVRAPQGPARGAVILVHGAGADRRAMMKHLPYLRAAGFHVLLIDCQNHGTADNDGRGISYGHFESESVVAAREWLSKAMPGVAIGVFGTSLGAVTALLAAAKDPAIRAVVGENPFFSLQRALQDVPILGWVPGIMRAHVATVLSFWHGYDFTELDARIFGPRVRQPTLLIHGAEDASIPYRHSQDVLQQLASGDKEIWLVPYGEHEMLWNRNREEFESRVTAFFRRTLAP